MNTLKSIGIKLSEGMSITSCLSGETTNLKLPSGDPKTYNIVGGGIVFIDENADVFAIPEIPGAKGTLVCDDYRKDSSLDVPFVSEEAYPTAYKAEWLALLAEMRDTV